MLDDVSSQHGSRGALWSWGPMRGDSSCPGKVLVPRECPGVLVSWCPLCPGVLPSAPFPARLCQPQQPQLIGGDVQLFLPSWPSSQAEGGRWTRQGGPGRQDPSPRFLLESELILSCAAVFLCLVLLVQPRVRGELSSQS